MQNIYLSKMLFATIVKRIATTGIPYTSTVWPVCDTILQLSTSLCDFMDYISDLHHLNLMLFLHLMDTRLSLEVGFSPRYTSVPACKQAKTRRPED